MLALGRHRASFLEGPVGLAILILICTVVIRLPGDAATSLAASAIVVVASLGFLVVRREAILGPAVGIALPVALLAGLLASLPFIASGHIGIPGVGLNNDMAMHLVDTDYLLDPNGPQPQSFVNGYPIGPHSLVATVANLLGTEPLQGWLGLLHRRTHAHGDHLAGCAAGASRLAAHPRRRARRPRLPDRFGPRDRRLQGADRRHVPDRLRAGPAGNRARTRRPHRDRDRPRADHGRDGPRLQPARRRLARDHRLPVAAGSSAPHPVGERSGGRAAGRREHRCRS